MIFRPLGDTGIKCSVIGLGTGRLASVSGGISRAEAGRLIGVAEECGVNFIDTADSYAQGECEKIIGRALQGRRERFVVTTKAGYSFTALGGRLRLIKPLAKKALKFFKGGKKLAGSVRSNVSRQDFMPESIRKCVEASLRRLQTDYVDVFLLHSPPPHVMVDIPLFDLLRQLKQEGKIRHFGVSTPEPVVLEGAMGVAGLSVVQTPLSPVQTGSRPVLSRLAAAQISVVANQIFLSGRLIGGPPAGREEELEVARLKKDLESRAAARGISLQRLLIKNALAQAGVVSVLTGTTKAGHLKQNVDDALSEDILTAAELATLNA